MFGLGDMIGVGGSACCDNWLLNNCCITAAVTSGTTATISGSVLDKFNNSRAMSSSRGF